MKQLNYILIILILFSANSCIKEEAPNKEADILSIEINKEFLKSPPIIKNDEIICYVKAETPLASLSPAFTITAGASITPASGTTRDFTSPKTYTVISEDKEWQKDYTVSFIASDISKKYHFDNYEIKDNKYQVLYEVDEEGNKNMTWASGNSGFSFIASGLAAEDYPTSIEADGFMNSAAKLVTCSTGQFGEMFKSPLAAGNLFMGNFVLDTSNPLKSTHFGIPVTYEPITFKGYYKYQSGEVFKRYTDENGEYIPDGGEILDRRDSCDIYAVFYEPDEATTYLDGTNILTHQNIVSIARLNQSNETANWTFFEIPFVKQEGKTIDKAKLKAGGYKLALVFSSSKDGNIYNGAIGSTLLVDEIELMVR